MQAKTSKWILIAALTISGGLLLFRSTNSPNSKPAAQSKADIVIKTVESSEKKGTVAQPTAPANAAVTTTATVKKTWTIPTPEQKRKFLTENKVFQ